MKFASVNIEHSKHLHRVQAFLEQEQPDVTCLQEVNLKDLPFLTNLAGPHLAWGPMCIYPNDFGPDAMGIALLSRHPLTAINLACYRGNPVVMPTYQKTAEEVTTNDSINFHLLTATVTAAGQTYRIGTTHMPVTVQGNVTEDQMRSIASLLTHLRAEAATPNGLAFAGDFNAPRGRQAFNTLAAEFTDNIPPHYTTSLDGTLHRAGPLPYMVDGLFTTPHYRAENVQLHTGVSDHCAITALISKA